MAFFLSASGCAVVGPRITEDTIIKIYADERAKPKDYPLIFIPGFFGTILEDGNTGRVIWGNVPEGLIAELELPIDSDNMLENKDGVVPAKMLTEFSIIPGFFEKDIYGRAKYIAVKAAGYEMGKTAFSLAYDWRRDLVEGARRLGELIDKIKRDKGMPDLKFDIVCHSAGGLIARYYAKYGTEDVLDRNPIPEPTYAGAKNIDKIIMLGTPNYGSMQSFLSIHQGLRIPGIGKITKEIIFSMPSAFELMPFYGKTAFIDTMGRDLDVSLYEPGNWEKYGWSVFGHPGTGDELRAKQRRFLAAALKRAAAFQEALWKGSSEVEGKNVTYILLGSDADPTSNKALLQNTGSAWKTRFDPHDDTINDFAFAPGDNTVTRRSLLGTHLKKGKEEEFPSAYEIFLAQDHVDLPDDPTFLDNVLHSLLDNTGR
jgi:pimeloyl-ACP methyl ester carboxylesterase